MHARNGNGVYTLNQAATPPPFSTRRIYGDNEGGILTAGAWQAAGKDKMVENLLESGVRWPLLAILLFFGAHSGAERE